MRNHTNFKSGHALLFKYFGCEMFLFCLLATNLLPERNELIPRFLDIFTNFRQERNDLFFDFCLFNEFERRREVTYYSNFIHFYEFETIKELMQLWLECLAILTILRLERNGFIARFWLFLPN